MSTPMSPAIRAEAARQREVTDHLVAKWTAKALDAGFGDVGCEPGYISHWLEATENANALYWDDETAKELTGGPVAPPTMLSVWMRPLMFNPIRDEGIRPLEIHFQLKDAFALPEGIVAKNEITFHEPVRPGDRVRTVQRVRSISDVKTIRIGTGRFWIIDVEYTNQDGLLVGLESYDMFSYVRLPEESS